MKEREKKLCECKIPKIKIKNSENGIHFYCGNCAKEYKTRPTKEESDENFVKFRNEQDLKHFSIKISNGEKESN